MKIQLGVVEQKYTTGTASTSEVANFLETKYGILGAMVQKKAPDIQRALEGSFVKGFEEVAAGLPQRNVYAGGLSQIQAMMKQWLSTQEVERVGLPGVPTKAALDGVSHRFKSGLKGVTMAQKRKGVRKGQRRPSFIDTGLMQASYRAWIDEA